MIDIHSHILPGLDDGPKTLEESVAMLRMAAAAGTTDMVATPHCNFQFAFDPERVDQKIAELAAASGGVPRIHRGCDFHLTMDNIQDAIEHPARYAINGKRYVLVEFSDLLIPKSTAHIFDRLHAANLTPIITHPERNGLLRRRTHELRAWVEDGALIQVTAHAFLGRFGRSARSSAHQLLEAGLVHFAASDAHDTRHRPPTLEEPYRYIARKFSPSCAEILFRTNPQAALAGEPIDSGAPGPTRRRRWFPFGG